MDNSQKTGLRVFSSNSMEVLGDLCAVIMSEYPLKDPFSREKIVVMNLGMQTFLSQRIATQNKITALCDYVQIWQLIYQTHRMIHPFASKESLFDREHITWNIYSQITEWEKEDLNNSAFEHNNDEASAFEHTKKDDIFAKLRYYIKDDEFGDKAYELAAKIADTFDQYQMYRPRWIKSWNFLKLKDFEDYERDPDDLNNPINKFIENECERFRREKGGFKVYKHKRDIESKYNQELEKYTNELSKSLQLLEELNNKAEETFSQEDENAIFELEERINKLKQDIQKCKENTDLLISEDNKSIAENEIVSKDRVEMLRQLFKSNIWQMKLWSLLRSNLDVAAISSLAGVSKNDEIYRWTINHLDRSQVMEGLIQELYEAGRIFVSEDEVNLDDYTDPKEIEELKAFIAERERLRKIRDDKKKNLPELYERIFIFGVSSLPRVVIEFIDALSLHCNVNLMLLNPCREYWGDIASRYRRDFDAYVKNIQASYKDVSTLNLNYKQKFLQIPLYSLYERDYDDSGERVDGHPLLLAYGQQGRDNIYMLVDREFPPDIIPCYPANEYEDEYEEEVISINGEVKTIVRGGTLLSRIQYQLLNLEHSKEQYVISSDDVSLSIHSCHTKRREVEILHDAILECFNRAKLENRKLLPRDIVVMVPTINEYAPHITAVFGSKYKQGDKDFIPFVISDQTETDANTVAQSLLQLLEISTTRITSSMVIELLSENAIANRFGLTRDNVEVIAGWLSENNIFWGLDDEDVSEFSEIPIPGTFAQGMDRMLLGSMLGDSDDMPCFSEIEGSDAVVLGKFWDFLQALRELRARFTPQLALEPESWAIELDRMLTKRFFDDSPETLMSLKSVQKVITELQTVISHLINKPKINLPVFAATLRQGLTAQRNFRPFLREKVNFCSLVPMRAVPFEHVFILGLNDIDFPREERAPGFNLMSSRELFERGDRSRAIDDRFLFLEAILSARRSLYLSYIGQSPIDKSTLNPSVVLSELMYYINDMCTVEGLGEVDALTRQQAVEKRILTQERLNSYHMDNYIVKNGDSFENSFSNEVISNNSGSHKKSHIESSHEEESQPSGIVIPKNDLSSKKINEQSKLITNASFYESQKVPSFNRSYIQITSSQKDKVNLLGSGIFDINMNQHAYKVIELNTLKDFIKNPSKFFLQNIIDIRINDFGRYSLQEDESFDLDKFNLSIIISDLLNMPKESWLEYLERKSTLGDLPYGIFKNEICHNVLSNAYKISDSLKRLFGFDTLNHVKQLTCPKQVFTLSLPQSLFEHRVIPPIIELVKESDSNLHNTINVSRLFNSATSISNEEQPLSSMKIDRNSDGVLQTDEIRADNLVFNLTLQANCRSRPLVVYFYSAIDSACKSYFNSMGEEVKIVEGAIKKSSVVWEALFEAISHFLYNGSLQKIAVVDINGVVFEFKPFSSRDDALFIIKSLLVMYLQGLAAPMPCLKHVINGMIFNKEGELVLDDPTNIAFSNDSFSEYLYRNIEQMMSDDVLRKKIYNFNEFYIDYIAPRFVLWSSE